MSEVKDMHELVLQRPLLTERILRSAAILMMTFHETQYLIINAALSRTSEVTEVRLFDVNL
jgi:hypothetical protein